MSVIKKVLTKVDDFFFTNGPVEGLAIFRIVWMGLIFMYYLLDLSNVDLFYGPEAIVSLETTRAQFPYLHANIFHLFSTGYEATYAIVAIYGVSLLASVLGLWTRPALLVSLICMTSLHQRNIWLLSSSELLMRIMTLYLIFSPCGHAFSLDSYLRRKSGHVDLPRVSSLWSLRLIQIQISVIYLWTFWHKTKGESWLDGTAVYYATRIDFLKNFSIPLLLDSHLTIKLLTWGTLLIEFALGFFVWFKDYRRPVILLGIAFHLGIEFVMAIPFFELYMMALFINFVPPEELKNFSEKTRERFRSRLKLIQTWRGEHEPAN